MECVEEASASSVEEDLVLSEDNSTPIQDHWPQLPIHDTTQSPLARQHEVRAAGSTTAIKRRVDEVSNQTTTDCPAPVTKTARAGSPTRVEPVSRPPLPQAAGMSRPAVSNPTSGLPPLAPRDTYVKLLFNEDPSTDTKLLWLSAVNKAFHLQRELAEVKMSAVTSRFVYISRQRSDIIDRVKTGEFLGVSLTPQDSPKRPRKYPSYILTRYPVNVDPSLATSYPGVYSARRFIQDGAPIARIVVVWSLPDPPPSAICFDFLPCLPPCEVRKLLNDKPTCFRCWGIGHISRYCAALPKCAWCAAAHDSRTCPNRSEAPRADSSVDSPPPPPADTSQWKCPRCLQPGVNVWHGCRRNAPSAAPPSLLPPPPPPPAQPQVGAAPSTDMDLRKAVASLMVRCAALEGRFAALEGRIDSLVTAHASSESKLSQVVEAQQGVLTAITFLTEKMDSVVARLGSPRESPSRPSTSRRKIHR